MEELSRYRVEKVVPASPRSASSKTCCGVYKNHPSVELFVKDSHSIIAGNSVERPKISHTLDSIEDIDESTILAGRLHTANPPENSSTVYQNVMNNAFISSSRESNGNSDKENRAENLNFSQSKDKVDERANVKYNKTTDFFPALKINFLSEINTLSNERKNTTSESQLIKHGMQVPVTSEQKALSPTIVATKTSEKTSECEMNKGKSVYHKQLRTPGRASSETMKSDRENINPQTGTIKRAISPQRNEKPKIISDEKLPKTNIPIIILQRPSVDGTSPSAGEDQDWKSLESSSCTDSSEKDVFKSVLTKSEEQCIGSSKTPVPDCFPFIEDCCKSTPILGVIQNSVSSVDQSPILACTETKDQCSSSKETRTIRKTRSGGIWSALSSLDNELNSSVTDSAKIPGQMLKRLSAEHAISPGNFIERLVTIIEESVVHSDSTAKNLPDVSLSNVIEEFKKMGRLLEDESMPEWPPSPEFQFEACTKQGTVPTLDNRLSVNDRPATRNSRAKASPARELINSKKTKKVYPRSPRYIFKARDPNSPRPSPLSTKSVHCKKRNLKLLGGLQDIMNDDSFIHLERMCNNASPDDRYRQRSRQKKLIPQDASIPKMDDIIAISERQMASLDDTIAESGQPRSPHPTCNQLQIEDPIRVGRRCIYKDELEESLLLELSEKRQRCFDTAQKMIEIREDPVAAEAKKSLEQFSELLAPVESAPLNRDSMDFLNTLTRCTEYSSYIMGKHQKLQGILQQLDQHTFCKEKSGSNERSSAKENLNKKTSEAANERKLVSPVPRISAKESTVKDEQPKTRYFPTTDKTPIFFRVRRRPAKYFSLSNDTLK